MNVLSSFGCCAARERELPGDQYKQPTEQLLKVEVLSASQEQAAPQCPVVSTEGANLSLPQHAGESRRADAGLGCAVACNRILASSCGGCLPLRQRQDGQEHKSHGEGRSTGCTAAVAKDKISAFNTTAAAAAAAAVQNDGAEALLALFDDRSLESPEHVLDKKVCSRFLVARKGHLGKATRGLRKYQAWRKAAKPALVTLADIPREFATGKAKHHGLDLAGRPIVWVCVCRHDRWSRDIEECIRLFLFCLEGAIHAGEASSMEQVTFVFDLMDFGARNLDLDLVSRFLELLVKFYPERVVQVLLWRAPRMFPMFWKVIRPVLDPDTFQKCKFVSEAELPEFIDPKQIPEDFPKQDVSGTYANKSQGNVPN